MCLVGGEFSLLSIFPRNTHEVSLRRDLGLLGLVRPRLLPGLAGHHATPGHALKQLLDLRGAVHELVRPELEGRILDQLNKSDEEAPGVWSVYNQPLE